MIETHLPHTMTVNEVIHRFPASVAVFNAFGIDSCCGGGESLEAAARLDGVELDRLLAALDTLTSHGETGR
jgi:iron-sulfur cluster repair protein YtfE (RIC family)